MHLVQTVTEIKFTILHLKNSTNKLSSDPINKIINNL